MLPFSKPTKLLTERNKLFVNKLSKVTFGQRVVLFESSASISNAHNNVEQETASSGQHVRFSYFISTVCSRQESNHPLPIQPFPSAFIAGIALTGNIKK